MNQAASSLSFSAGDGKLNTTGSNTANILLYFATLAGTFLAENWYLVIMVVFGGIHAYAAWRKHKREEQESEYKKKDRELLLARDEERARLELELKKKHKQKVDDEIYINEMERQRNRDHLNKRAELYCEHPEKRRTSMRVIDGDQ
jgi:flagellar biosynthesis/type III secretory pathway M-ring protein FliF/YscJ